MLKNYLIGFALSLALTLAAYFAVVGNYPNAVLIILTLALAQLLIQLIFFLHLHKGPGWNLVVLLSTVGIVLILVVGSLWIMNHLNYNMMLPVPLDSNYLINQ